MAKPVQNPSTKNETVKKSMHKALTGAILDKANLVTQYINNQKLKEAEEKENAKDEPGTLDTALEKFGRGNYWDKKAKSLENPNSPSSQQAQKQKEEDEADEINPEKESAIAERRDQKIYQPLQERMNKIAQEEMGEKDEQGEIKKPSKTLKPWNIIKRQRLIKTITRIQKEAEKEIKKYRRPLAALNRQKSKLTREKSYLTNKLRLERILYYSTQTIIIIISLLVTLLLIITIVGIPYILPFLGYAWRFASTARKIYKKKAKDIKDKIEKIEKEIKKLDKKILDINGIIMMIQGTANTKIQQLQRQAGIKEAEDE